jgi:hypothetical protein
MMPDMRVLTLNSFGETAADDLRVTLSAMNIKAVIAQDGNVQNRPVKITTVMFMGDPEAVTLKLSEFDLLQLESVVGAYGFFEE